MPLPTPDQLALVQRLLPSVASQSTASGGYGWDNNYVTIVMTERGFTPTEAVRYFWLQRVNETSEYLDISGKPITEIHKQAREMLDYWDNVLKIRGRNSIGPGDKRPLSFGKIDMPDSYERVQRWWTQT